MERCYRCMRGHIVNGVCNNCKRRPAIHTAASNSKLVLEPGTPLLDGAITVGALLGKGGFGATYVADTQQFGVICLKEFLPSYMLEDERDGNALLILPDKQTVFEKSRTAFEKECKLISQLHHDNIVQVLFRFWENNTAYYGMQLLEGSDLAGFMKARKDVPVTAEVAADFIERMYPVMDALKYLHRRGVYHRDISPANIFLRGWNKDTDKYNLNFDPCLIDFGAAFVAREDYTKSFARVKNIHYSPYEQNLSFSTLTPASDIYSLCATLYHVLTGKAPDPAMDRMVEYSESKTDPLKKPGEINPALRPLNNALMHGLAIAVQNRTANVDQLMKELAEAVQSLRSGVYQSDNEEVQISGGGNSGNGKVLISGGGNSGNDPVQISGNRKEDFYGTGGNPPPPPPPPPPPEKKDSGAKSIFALLMDIFIALIFGCIPAANGYGTWTIPPLTLAVLFVINLITMLAAKRTLGQMIFGMRKRSGSAGRKILAVLVRTIVPFALVDVILSACGAYPAALCNGAPEADDIVDIVRKPETEVGGTSIPPISRPPIFEQSGRPAPQPPVKPIAPPPVKPVVMQPVPPVQPAPPPQPKSFFIMVANYNGPNGRRMVYPLYEGFKYRVGRDVMSQIQTPDHLRTVSGYHCEIEVAGGIVRVTDHSSNGSSVENYTLEKGVTYKWKLGTTLKLADAVRFQLIESRQ